MLNTERLDPAHAELDLYDLPRLMQALITSQQQAAEAVAAAQVPLCAAVAAAQPRIQAGGRLVYVGAGTSGRLGVLDSVELYPTFSWPKQRALSLLAGGPQAMFVAVEGAEDDAAQGERDLQGLGLGPLDVVLLLAASGTTPYVLGALQAARAAGALTIGFSNNPGTPVASRAEIGIVLDTGPELISGSTRLKAGTAQKIALNSFSSALMVKLNKVYGNLMVDLQPTNAKLLKRAVTLTQLGSGADEAQARDMLARCDQNVKTALVALLGPCEPGQARAALDSVQGSVRAALAKLNEA